MSNNIGRSALSIPLAILIVAGCIAANMKPVSAETTTLVPRHTIVPVVLTKEIRVGGMGDSQVKKVEFEAATDVIVNGYIVVKQGDTVEGHYTSTRNTTKSLLNVKISEELSLDVDDVANFCGDTLHLQFERTFRGAARQSVIGMVSHDAVFDKGTILLARLDRVEKHVCSERTNKPQPPIPVGLVPDDQTTDTGN